MSKVQRRLLAMCIALVPVSITLYVQGWPENPASVISATTPAPVVTSALAGPTGNVLHFIGGIAASFFLPVGYLGMSLLGMRRAPGLATLSAALSLVGWIPWSALIALDDLAYDIAEMGSSPELGALWLRFNGDAVMMTYLLIYIVAHLLSAVLIGVMLGRLSIVPGWAAWAFALTSPLTMAYFVVHVIEVRYVLRDLLCVLWTMGTLPAALAMLREQASRASTP
jgi:hypothetical protein